MVVDSRGRADAGNFGFDLMAFADPQPANLIRVDPDGTASVAASDMLFPNGSVITPDGRTLIVDETAGARYTEFAIEDDGSLSGRRMWPQVAETPEITTLEETLGKLRFRARWLRARRRGRCPRPRRIGAAAGFTKSVTPTRVAWRLVLPIRGANRNQMVSFINHSTPRALSAPVRGPASVRLGLHRGAV